MGGISGLITLLVIASAILASVVKILSEWERGVVLRFGRAIGVKGPGLIILIPFVDKMVKVDTRTVTMDIPTQDIITKDNVSLKVNAVVYFKVTSPMDAITRVEDFDFATSQLAQTTLRSIMGQFDMDDILTQRDKINQQLQEILDEDTDPWGIKVSLVEIKHIDLPQEMQRAMAKEAEAERDRRAKIIQAEGELQASDKLSQAAHVMAQEPIAVQLRYLDTLRSIGTEHNSTIVFPLPLDMVDVFLKKQTGGKE